MSLTLTDAEQRTLIEMGIRHPHPRVRRRAQGLVRLAQGVSYTQLAREFEVHVNSVRHWLAGWQTKGLIGLYEGHRKGRPKKLSPEQRERLRRMAQEEAGNISQLMRRFQEQGIPLHVQRATVARCLKEMGIG